MSWQYVAKNGKLLRCGYTTGSCAAAAAKAATELLLCGTAPSMVMINTPAGVPLTLQTCEPSRNGNFARCAIRKDGGDDPDVTSGLLIHATVHRCVEGVNIDGGEGVGRVTKPGLNQPVGAAAINSTPRAMIKAEVSEVCKRFGYKSGIAVTISIPGGEAVAAKTFNSRMGIIGGLSIVGTTGIVEPMSSKALVDSMKLELSQKVAYGEKSILLVPGNYGTSFAVEKLNLPKEKIVMCSNFIGDAINAAVELGFESILLVGHIGKLVKLALGNTNTHSFAGDGRIEALLLAALQSGAELPLLRKIADSVSTDAVLALLLKEHLLLPTMQNIGAKISGCLSRHVPSQTEIGYVCFTNAPDMAGVLTQSDNAERLMNLWRN